MVASEVGTWSYVYDPDLEVELEVVVHEVESELDDAWFEQGLERALAAELESEAA